MYTLTIKLSTEDKAFIESILKTLFTFSGNNKNLTVETQPEMNTFTIRNSENQKQEIIRLLKQNLSTEEIAQKLGVKKSTVAAYKAHFTMGHYL